MRFRRGRSKHVATLTAGRVAARCSKMSTHELSNWVDTSVMSLGQAVDNWRYHSGPLGEVRLMTNVLNDLVMELEKREL